MNAEHPHHELPPNLKAKLEQFRRAVWGVKIAEGLLAALFGLGLSYLVVFALDRFFDTPQTWRALILVAGASGFGFWFPTKCHKWVWEKRSLEETARLLRHKFPRLGDQLLGIVELARHAEGSDALIGAAFKQADSAVKDEHFGGAVPQATHWRWGLIAGGVVALMALAFVMAPKPSKNALARWLQPWKDTDRYTYAQIGKMPDSVVVPYAEPFDLAVALSEQSDHKPEFGVAGFEDQEAVKAQLRDGDYDFEMAARSKEGTLKVKVGDDSEKIKVVPTTRPELTAMTASVQLPDYLRYERDLEIEMRDGTVSLVKGSQATISGEVGSGRELKEASIDNEALELEGGTFSTQPIFIDDTKKHELTWKDGNGLTAKEPLVLRINARDDEEPGVRAKMTSQEQVVLVSEAVKLELEVVDDFGVREVGLEWVGAPRKKGGEPRRGSKIVAAGEPEQLQIGSDATFVAEREGVEPQTIQLAAYAVDYLPGRARAYSRPFVIHILSPEQHAMWLTEQLGKWFRQSQEVYEREKQLHATNKALRDMPTEQLDSPEARAQIEAQAQAENTNAKRLDNLTKVGEELLEHGTRNDEFDADRLELWAKMIEQLEKIAKNRMPSVSDMLSDAAKSDKAQEPQEGKPGESSPKPFGENKEVAENKKNEGSDKGKKKSGKPKSGPKISDKESGFALTDKVGENAEEEEKKEQTPGGSAGLKLPGTTLAKAPGSGKKEQQSPAQSQTEQAVVEQTGLLEEFENISEQLQDLLGSLEASTFVKRLKAASREQMVVAGDLNSTLVGGFGKSGREVAEETKIVGGKIAEREEEQSDVVHVIQDDLQAYFHRKQDLRYKNILTQMQEDSVVAEIRDIGEEVRVNLNGRSIAAAEYWADTLDRWAEELVSASECKACEGQGNGDGLPPKIVLEVMKILHEEIQLREETRELEKAKPALKDDGFGEKASALSAVQKELRNRTYGVAKEIESMPQGARRFGKEIQLLTGVSQVMSEAKNILGRPDTGPKAIAAETEAIEMLLEARRSSGGGGGGGGGDPGGGGGGAATRSALARVGPGGDPGAHIEDREVGQATGKQGRELPEEFRNGLDAYFNALERGSGS